tara:strand:- start:138835 stop:139857 length:1023 start_codon:yes stop_codon:yes gene_type:complete
MLYSGTDSGPLPRLELAYAGRNGAPEPHLSVDGMTPAGPNLSHWPGNRTPPQWRADLSTGIALRFARAPEAEQEAFLGGVRCVVNDHYDTDGFGALLAVLQPDVAFRHEELLLTAAATGDFGCWTTWRGFAIDRIVKHLGDEHSPVRGAIGRTKDQDELCLRRYQWLMERGESMLAHIASYKSLYEEEMALVQSEIDAAQRGAIELRQHPALGFSSMHSQGPRHRMTLNTLAGAYRVLHVQQDAGETCYRYHDRTESWFDLVTVQALPRRDLRPLAQKLAALEPEHDGASWQADPPTTPIPELYFGVPAEQEYGEITRELRPSKLAADQVVAAFVEFFAS